MLTLNVKFVFNDSITCENLHDGRGKQLEHEKVVVVTLQKQSKIRV